MMKYQNLLFDLDGTLTDPGHGIINGLKYSLDKFGITENDSNKLRRFIGPPLVESFIEFYHFDEEKAKTAVIYYREYYSKRGIYENELYGNMEQLLKQITAGGRNCLVATSKPQEFAQRVLKHFNIDIYFMDVLGSNFDGTMTDKREIVKTVITRNNLNKVKTVMIGDRKHDIIGAKANDIDSIAVSWGYGSIDELEEVEPAYICKNVLDILDII